MKYRRLSFRKLVAALFLAQLPLVGVLAAGTDPMVQAEPARIIRYTFPSDGVSNDSLFRHYVEERFESALPGHDASGRKSSTRSGIDGLSGNDAKLYRALVPKIQAIARGDLRSGIIEIPASEILDCNIFTAEQLGISAIVANGTITQEVQDRIDEIRGIDLGNILYALLTDLPYELYWFDKAVGMSYSLPTYGYSSSVVQIVPTSTYVFYFHVAKEYSAANAVETTDLGTKPAAVTTALTTAQHVVEAASGTPLQKMWYYYNWISDNVAYNFDAAEMNPVVYGNPWQMIWAFDNDPSTKVVCEGYSKAFKYLCDLSGFQDIECLLATGGLGSVSGGVQGPPGPHMWNVVRMDDGRNYLVDVTNGRNFRDQLFMFYRIDWSQFGFSQYNDGYASGYHLVYDYDGNSISFTYDDVTKITFGEQALTLSTEEYTGSPAKKVTLSETGSVAAQIGSYAGQSDVHVNFRRTGLTVGQPATVCLPFAFPLPQINVGTFYTLSSVEVSETTGKWEATMSPVSGSTLQANTPYILIPTFTMVDFSGDYTIPASVTAGSTARGRWSLKGNYAPKSWTAEADDYGFAAGDGRAAGDGSYLSAGTFVKCTAGASVAPMRCYLSYSAPAGTRGMSGQLPSTISVRFLDALGDTTAIGELDTVTGGLKDDVWYDLQGRRLPGRPAAKGVYIQNGRKVVVGADR